MLSVTDQFQDQHKIFKFNPKMKNYSHNPRSIQRHSIEARSGGCRSPMAEGSRDYKNSQESHIQSYINTSNFDTFQTIMTKRKQRRNQMQQSTDFDQLM